MSRWPEAPPFAFGASLALVPLCAGGPLRALPRPPQAFRGRQAPIAMRELKTWVDAAKKKLHDNVLGIALANKLARIAWAVLNKERAFECVKTRAKASEPA